MKVLEASSGILTNVEVYDFLNKQAKTYHDQKRRGPGNLETLRKEMLKYFEEKPGPLSQKPTPFNANVASKLMERLRKYELLKGEILMIINLRPTSVPSLNTVIEEMEARFKPEEQEDIVNGVIEVLGQFPEPSDGEDQDEVMESTEAGR